MSSLMVTGGEHLRGEISVEGSKNAVLPILVATILNSGINIINNCPRIKDVESTMEILKKIGCGIQFEGNRAIIDSSTLNCTEIPEDLAVEMRSSIIFIGPMLSRLKKVTISYPGGCEIGPRPIDLHLKALRSMGAKINDVQGGFICCEAVKMTGCDIHLDYPSVGATENIMLASVFAEGETTIRNAAKEPEIIDLQNFLIGLGVSISGAGTSQIHIKGDNVRLRDVEHTMIPDRIVSGTYMIASAITNGDIQMKNVIPEHIGSIISILRECGCRIQTVGNSLRVIGNGRPKAVDIIRTLPYPGFPTDMQAQMVALLSVSKGTSMVIETVFENRFKHVDELLRMGANIKIEGRLAVIQGVKKLVGAPVHARDLRGGAALVLAALAAEGETVIYDTKLIERGYEDLEFKLGSLGARIRSER